MWCISVLLLIIMRDPALFQVTAVERRSCGSGATCHRFGLLGRLLDPHTLYIWYIHLFPSLKLFKAVLDWDGWAVWSRFIHFFFILFVLLFLKPGSVYFCCLGENAAPPVCCEMFLWTTKLHLTSRWHEGEHIMTDFSLLGELLL